VRIKEFCDIYHLFISHLLIVKTRIRKPAQEHNRRISHVGILSNIFNLNFQQQDPQYL